MAEQYDYYSFYDTMDHDDYETTEDYSDYGTGDASDVESGGLEQIDSATEGDNTSDQSDNLDTGDYEYDYNDFTRLFEDLTIDFDINQSGYGEEDII